MRDGTKSALVSVAIGAGAGALVGFGIWWYAERKMEQSFQEGLQRLASELGVGSSELNQQMSAGTTALRAELAQQVEAQVRPAVAGEIRTTLSSYGITPEVGRRINLVLSAAERLNLI
jgi:hypothetical protein